MRIIDAARKDLAEAREACRLVKLGLDGTNPLQVAVDRSRARKAVEAVL